MRPHRIAILAVASLFLLGCRELNTPKSVPPPKESEGTLSATASAFLESVEEDNSGFHFNVSFWDHEAGTSEGVTFVTKRSHSSDGSETVIDDSVALAITRHFAHSGMLDKTDVPPPGSPIAGWNVSLGTMQVGAFWHLARKKGSLLESEEIMGVREVLDKTSREAWDRIVQPIRKVQSQQPGAQ